MAGPSLRGAPTERSGAVRAIHDRSRANTGATSGSTTPAPVGRLPYVRIPCSCQTDAADVARVREVMEMFPNAPRGFP
jgi:hypothetical protein